MSDLLEKYLLVDKEIAERVGYLYVSSVGDIVASLEDFKKIAKAQLTHAIPIIAEEIKILALEAIADEPEYPGDLPDELWRELDGNRDNVSLAMRSTVRLTKNGITGRFLASLLVKDKGEIE